MYRRRTDELHYRAYSKQHKATSCALCDINNPSHNPNPRETYIDSKYTLVVDNGFPYTMWEWLEVKEHRMILPKRHVSTLAELTATERVDMMNIICDYEAKGYNVYFRAPTSSVRSLSHVHGHLIKTTGKKPKAAFLLEKPYTIFKV